MSTSGLQEQTEQLISGQNISKDLPVPWCFARMAPVDFMVPMALMTREASCTNSTMALISLLETKITVNSDFTTTYKVSLDLKDSDEHCCGDLTPSWIPR